MMQFGQDQGGALISTGGIQPVFRGLQWEPTQISAEMGRFETASSNLEFVVAHHLVRKPHQRTAARLCEAA